MAIQEYREYLQRQGIPGNAIAKQMAIVEDFLRFLTDLGLTETLELRGEVLESALKGDTRCRFVFHLPTR